VCLSDEDLVGDTPFVVANNTAYQSRSNKDRWSDSYRLTDEPLYAAGVTATNAAALQHAVASALATNRGEVILPRGEIMLETTVALVNPGPDPTEKNAVRIVGQGPDATWIRNTAANQKWLSIGNDAVGVTIGIVLEGFSAVPSVAMNDNGSVFFERNTKDIAYKSIIVRAVRNGWSFGVGAPAINNSCYPALVDCGGTSAGASGAAMIRLGSGGGLRISGCGSRWNAVGRHNFIEHDDPYWNWDGLYVYGQFLEHWRQYLTATAKGVVNVDWSGGQMDRADIFFHAEAGVGGSNRGWKIHDNDILGFPCTFDTNGAPILNGAIGILTGAGQSSDPRAIENIMVTNNRFDGLSDACIYASNGEITVIGNTMVNCANWGGGAPSGGALIRLGQGRAKIQANTAFRPNNPYGNAYRYAVQCDGPSYPRRKVCGDNDWYDFGDRTVSGTP
jgi:hypothetical protein